MSDIEANLKEMFKFQTEDSCIFDIRKSPTRSLDLGLFFLNGTEFGVLDIHTSKALDNLVQQSGIQFEAIGSIQTIREIIGRVTKQADAVTRVNINTYGPRDSRKIVGRHLSGHKLYLQRPDKPRIGSIYENPHFLSFADMQISSYENQLDVGSIKAPKTGASDTFGKTISNVYSSLTRGEKLGKIKGDRRLKSPLLPYVFSSLTRYFIMFEFQVLGVTDGTLSLS